MPLLFQRWLNKRVFSLRHVSTCLLSCVHSIYLMKWVTRLAVGRPGSMEGTDAKVVNGEEEVQSAGKIMINRTGTGSFFFWAKRANSGNSSISTRSFQQGLSTQNVNRVVAFDILWLCIVVSPSCCGKVLAGWNRQSHGTSQLTTPPPAFWQTILPGLNPSGDIDTISSPSASLAPSDSLLRISQFLTHALSPHLPPPFTTLYLPTFTVPASFRPFPLVKCKTVQRGEPHWFWNYFR